VSADAEGDELRLRRGRASLSVQFPTRTVEVSL
jgi:hypothetical protein